MAKTELEITLLVSCALCTVNPI